jgi:protein-tyrosine phosphatase
MLAAMRRVIDLEGCLNFRDLGGYPTADGRRVGWRLVYRSDALHRLTAGDVARMRDDLGIRTVIDLRSSAELRAEGRGPLAAESIGFHHLPLFDGQAARPEAWPAIATLADRYSLLAEVAREPIARVVGILARAEGPAVYHCAAGKDRTGVVSAILLGLLGVPDEIVVADYAATQERLDDIIARLMEAEGYQTMLAALPPDTLHAEAETMVAFLAGIRSRYGSMAGYASAAGVEEADIARLRERLLESR